MQNRFQIFPSIQIVCLGKRFYRDDSQSCSEFMLLQNVIHNGLVLVVIFHHSEVHSYELIVYKKATHLSESAKNHSIGSDSKSKNSAQGRI